ncbi:metallophosphoesterase [Haematobacter missouriensis]|uniref:metallophosphoesterase n=1 Tax=Haematobacter missouriensis TaxID=366616 RepID=UPI001FD527CB|nr:metallophosphoesterase [Haematobacter missouriensis]
MNVLITADLHLDLWARAGRDPFVGILPVLRDLDALIIAGDLADDPQRNWLWALSRISRLVSPAQIWVIPGNHDYYGATLDDDSGPDRRGKPCLETGSDHRHHPPAVLHALDRLRPDRRSGGGHGPR